ncbi:unnamed protein product, partial [Choristocarpus tenellus]
YPQGEDDIHVVFSTDCTSYQMWQAVVLFHSAHLSGHKGPITQLVSGCTKEEEEKVTSMHIKSRHSPLHRQHFTPSYVMPGVEEHTMEELSYMNKPKAMWNWLQKVTTRETIIALVDPDFLFLKPLTTWLDPQKTAVQGDGLSLEGLGLERGEWVRKGFPAGQRFGLPNWTKWDLDKICPDETACRDASTQEARKYYDLIPPYLAHQEDWQLLVPEWVDQAPKVRAAQVVF